jgi:DNA repair protein RadC
MKLCEPDPIIREWPEAERPMTKLRERGTAALTDAELLAILIRNGSADKSAVDIAREVLARTPSLVSILSGVELVGLALTGEQAARIAVVTELARRALREKLISGDAMTSPGAVREYLRLQLQTRQHEVFCAVYLDTQNRVIAFEELFRGTLAQTSVYPREVVKAALRHNAGAVIFAHNHPSGIAEPSHADETLTTALKQALALVDVRVLDHFVVAGDGILSFAERGLL